MSTTIITGCALVDDAYPKVVWGDLHKVGATWVFNAVLEPNGEAAWKYNTPCSETTKQLIIDSHASPSLVFERRGIIVIFGAAAHLNKAARVYLGEAA